MDSDEQAFVWTGIFISFVYGPGHGYDGSGGHSLKNHQTMAVFHSGCIVVHPHQQCTGTPVSGVYCNRTARSLQFWLAFPQWLMM